MAAKTQTEENISVEELSKRFREYSIAEFFKKNRQMLGYSGKIRSLTTIVHEYVTNSLDACEDANTLPDIEVRISEENNHMIVSVGDNGTGIPRKNIGQALGQLLAGTKFAQRQQKRGQQGIGAAYATLFSQITTGKVTKFKTSVGNNKVVEGEVSVDVQKNEPVVNVTKEYDDHKYHGTFIEAEFSEVGYNKSEYGVYEYLRRTAVANPHAKLTLIEPSKEKIVFPRSIQEIPKKPKQVLSHPLGITTSDLIDMSKASEARKISSFFTNEFSRFSSDKVKEVESLCPGVDFNRHPKALTWQEAEKIVDAIQKIKWIAPESNVLVPIGEKQIAKSLKSILKPDEQKVIERSPKVFRGGVPFAVEVGIAYGGQSGVIMGDGTARKAEVMRFANRVPLLFDAGNCAITQAVKEIDWNRYQLKDWENQPLSIFVNFTSVHVPYTGAGKLAISAEEEIVSEIKLALMEAARSVSSYINSMRHAAEQEYRKSVFLRYVGEVSECLADITGEKEETIRKKLAALAKEKTTILLAGGDGDSDADDKDLDEMEKEVEKELEEER
ncbi:DNA topoisomerase VI subunit B [Candidatus Micrarchaeota archaeon]|nr:DNA topoisomerase VI subunit B [Candidatus Micrarchaeota archaeon]